MTTRRPFPPFFVLLITLLAAVGGACHREQERPSLCQGGLAESDFRDARPVRPEEWLRFIVRTGYGQLAAQECSDTAIAQPEPSSECRDEILEALRIETSQDEPSDTPVAVELSEESVIDQRISSTQRLIWIVTHRYPNGDGLGPVALVERHRYTEEELEDEDELDEIPELRVLAMGFLRARTERVRLQLEVLSVRIPGPSREGETAADRNRRDNRAYREAAARRRADRENIRCTDEDRPETCRRRWELLIVEGETCVHPEDPEEEIDRATCRRSAQLMLREGNRFVQSELRYEHDIPELAGPRIAELEEERTPVVRPAQCDQERPEPLPPDWPTEDECRQCIGRATVLVNNRTSRDLSGGWRRDFSLESSFEVRGGYIWIHEQVVVVDQDTRRPDVPPRPYRSAEAVSQWVPRAPTNFVTSSVPLWERMLSETASMQPVAEPAAQPPAQ